MREEMNDQNFDYELACTEVCGRGHFSMRLRVIVEEEADYRAWYNKQRPWLAANREEYLEKVPANLRNKALQIIGSGETPSASTSSAPQTSATEEVPVNTSVVKTSNTTAQ